MINDIYLHLSPSHKKNIRRMDENVSDMQKENRVKWAQLIQKQSELSARQHALSEKKLIHTKLKEEIKNKKKEMQKCQKEVDNYQSQLNSINKEILHTKMNLKALTTQISQTNLPDLTSVRESINKRRNSINEAQIKIKNLKKEVKNLDYQKENLIKSIDSKQKSLIKFNSRKEKVSISLQIPIDDLQLEEITVNKLEQSVFQMDKEIKINDSTSNLNEELLVKKIEEQNEKKKERIKQIKDRIKILKSQPPVLKNKRISKTPTKRLIKTQPIRYDENRLLRFNSTINSFKERQKMIDQLENTTTNVQIAWAADQKQIEDSWMGKMDDMQVLQKKVDEIENLVFDIDEISEKIHQLKEEEEFINEKKSEYLKTKSKIESKLSEIGEFHNSMQKQVDNYVKKKEMVDQTEEKLKNKKKKLIILQNEVKQLEKAYKQYYLKVKTIEDKVNEIKNSYNAGASHTQISELFDHVKFDEYLIPKMNDVNHYSKISVVSQIDIDRKQNENKEQPSTPVMKKNNFQQGSFTPKHDRLSDTTFSEGELGKDKITDSFIHNNRNDSITNSYIRYTSDHVDANNSINNDSFNNGSLRNSPIRKNSYYDNEYSNRYSSIDENKFDDKNNIKNSFNENKNDIDKKYSNHVHSSFNSKGRNSLINNSNKSSGIDIDKNKFNASYTISNDITNEDIVINSSISKNNSNNSKISNNSNHKSSNNINKSELNNNKSENRIKNKSNANNNNSKSSFNKQNSRNNISNSITTPQNSLIYKSNPNCEISNNKVKSGISSSKNSKSNHNNSSIHISHKSSSNKANTSLENDKNDIDNSDIIQDSLRSEIEIDFSDNENSRSISQSLLDNDSLKRTNISTNYSKDEKLNSIKQIIQEKETKEELILSKYENKNINNNQFSSENPTFNPKEYEAILNCTNSSRSNIMNDNSYHPNDTTFNQEELEDDIDDMIQEEEEDISNNIEDEKDKIEQNDEKDIFDNLSTSYQVQEELNPIFPAPELFTENSQSEKNLNDYESSKDTFNNNDEKEFQSTEFKNFYSGSAELQITPTKRSNHPSTINIGTNELSTPNANRYKHNQHTNRVDDESDDEFNNLVKEAQKAIEFPLLKSKYQSP